MGKKKLFKKYQQAARREARKHIEALDFDFCSRLIVKDKPCFMPKFFWKFLKSLILKNDQAPKPL